jgi:hypothetical protein
VRKSKRLAQRARSRRKSYQPPAAKLPEVRSVNQLYRELAPNPARVAQLKGVTLDVIASLRAEVYASTVMSLAREMRAEDGERLNIAFVGGLAAYNARMARQAGRADVARRWDVNGMKEQRRRTAAMTKARLDRVRSFHQRCAEVRHALNLRRPDSPPDGPNRPQPVRVPRRRERSARPRRVTAHAARTSTAGRGGPDDSDGGSEPPGGADSPAPAVGVVA